MKNVNQGNLHAEELRCWLAGGSDVRSTAHHRRCHSLKYIANTGWGHLEEHLDTEVKFCSKLDLTTHQLYLGCACDR